MSETMVDSLVDSLKELGVNIPFSFSVPVDIKKAGDKKGYVLLPAGISLRDSFFLTKGKTFAEQQSICWRHQAEVASLMQVLELLVNLSLDAKRAELDSTKFIMDVFLGGKEGDEIFIRTSTPVNESINSQLYCLVIGKYSSKPLKYGLQLFADNQKVADEDMGVIMTI